MYFSQFFGTARPPPDRGARPTARYISQINHFKDVINRKVEPVTSSEDAELTLKVALSILDSAVNKKSISI